MGKKFVIISTIFIMLLSLVLCSCSSTNKEQETKSHEETTVPQTTDAIIETDSPEIMYENAMNFFSEGDYNSAKQLFENLGDYEDSEDYLIACDFILQISGFYTYWKDREMFIFEIGKNVKVMDGDYKITEYKTISLENKNDEYRLIAEGDFGTYAFVIRNDAVMFFSWGHTPTSLSTADKYEEIYKMPDDYGFPTEPQIGMTADEVRKSTWGEPQKINTTITTNGTSEQWCYSNYRYVYLENGIVTSIQK